MKKDISIRTGTSGWMYRHWQEIFYPAECPQSKWLEYYTAHLDTVELNASFYRLPNPKTFENWKMRTPDNFLWSVKASKYITHTKRLKDPDEPLQRLYDAVNGLGEKLGVILIQLPPNLIFDKTLFRDFCTSLNTDIHHTLEVRHASWLNDDAYTILNEFNMALCISDTAGRYPYTEEITADFTYIRLHGSQKLYASGYTEDELQTWAHKIKAWDRNTFIFFDNDFEGHAVKDAKRLKKILGA